MANETSNDAGYYLDAVAESFFNWFQNDILPVCTTIFDILVILVGLVLNILLLQTFRRRGLFNDPSTYFVTMLIMADFVSYAFLLLPNIVSAIASKWILSDPVCKIHGSFIFLLVFVNFGFAAVLSVERVIMLCEKKRGLYGKIFETKKYRICIMVSVWLLACVVAFIPAMGVGVVRYDFYHQGCMLDYIQSSSFLIVHFILTIVVTSVVVLVSYSIIFNTRRLSLIKQRQRGIQATKRGVNEKRLLPSDSELPTISETDGDVNDTNQAFEKVPEKSQRTRGNMKSSQTFPKRRQSLLFEVFSDNVKQPAFHLSITYIALWGTIMICCLPYFVVSFYGTYNDGALWGGCYTITLLLMHTCFVAKPFVYLGHNRHYRHVTKQTVPSKVRKGANSVRKSVHSMSETVQDLIFRQDAQAKFRAALATQKVVAIWKKRTANNKGMIKLREESSPVSNNAAVDETAEPKTTEVDKSTKQTHNVSFKLPSNSDRASVTPSGVVVTTSPTPANVHSSYIEKERLRILGMHKQDNTAANNQPSDNNVSPVPGMISNDLAIV